MRTTKDEDSNKHLQTSLEVFKMLEETLLYITVTAIIADCTETTTLKSERKNEVLKTFREEILYNKIYYEETGERGIIICGQS